MGELSELVVEVERLVLGEAEAEGALEPLCLGFWGEAGAHCLHEGEVGVDQKQDCDWEVPVVQIPCDPRRMGEGLQTEAGYRPSETLEAAAAVEGHLELQHSKPPVVVCVLGPPGQQTCLHQRREAAR